MAFVGNFNVKCYLNLIFWYLEVAERSVSTVRLCMNLPKSGGPCFKGQTEQTLEKA